MPRPIDTLLLLALPASGKSEVRRYLHSLDPSECRDHFGIGPTVQLDDFPYVHLMRRISDELTTRGYEGPYFLSSQLPFRDPRDWGTLIELLNEDYADLRAGNRVPAGVGRGVALRPPEPGPHPGRRRAQAAQAARQPAARTGRGPGG